MTNVKLSIGDYWLIYYGVVMNWPSRLPSSLLRLISLSSVFTLITIISIPKPFTSFIWSWYTEKPILTFLRQVLCYTLQSFHMFFLYFHCSLWYLGPSMDTNWRKNPHLWSRRTIVPTKAIGESLRNEGVLKDYIRMVRVMYRGAETKVRIE